MSSALLAITALLTQEETAQHVLERLQKRYESAKSLTVKFSFVWQWGPDDKPWPVFQSKGVLRTMSGDKFALKVDRASDG